jgi:hypothetical protein
VVWKPLGENRVDDGGDWLIAAGAVLVLSAVSGGIYLLSFLTV